MLSFSLFMTTGATAIGDGATGAMRAAGIIAGCGGTAAQTVGTGHVELPPLLVAARLRRWTPQ